MFGLGIGEALVIAVAALLVFGPKGLPEAAKTLGRTAGSLRRTLDEMRFDLLSESPEDTSPKPNLKGDNEMPSTIKPSDQSIAQDKLTENEGN